MCAVSSPSATKAGCGCMKEAGTTCLPETWIIMLRQKGTDWLNLGFLPTLFWRDFCLGGKKGQVVLTYADGPWHVQRTGLESYCAPMCHPVQSALELLALQSSLIETDRDRTFRNESDISHSLGDGQCQVTLTSAVSFPVWISPQGYLKVGRDHAPHFS